MEGETVGNSIYARENVIQFPVRQAVKRDARRQTQYDALIDQLQAAHAREKVITALITLPELGAKRNLRGLSGMCGCGLARRFAVSQQMTFRAYYAAVVALARLKTAGGPGCENLCAHSGHRPWFQEFQRPHKKAIVTFGDRLQ